MPREENEIGLPYFTSTSSALMALCFQPVNMLDLAPSTVIQVKGKWHRARNLHPYGRGHGHLAKWSLARWSLEGGWPNGAWRVAGCTKIEVPRRASFYFCFVFFLTPSYTEWLERNARTPDRAEVLQQCLPGGFQFGLDFCPGDRGKCWALQQR